MTMNVISDDDLNYSGGNNVIRCITSDCNDIAYGGDSVTIYVISGCSDKSV